MTRRIRTNAPAPLIFMSGAPRQMPRTGRVHYDSSATRWVTEDERTTKPLKPAEVAHLASASAHELAREVLAGFTRNGEIPFALSGQAAADIIAVAIEADRAQRPSSNSDTVGS